MSTIESKFSDRNYSTLEKKHSVNPLSLNDVFKESLKKAQAQVDNLQLIIRCENLPLIKADEEEMVKLFDDLLGMILNHAPNGSKLFLYVDCEENINEPKEEKHYLIKFHTNITTHENWKLVNSQALVNCRLILSRHNGTLVVNDVSNTGCLFSFSLPGKIE
jgi:K+-sensing histidine kinase KdpD